MAESLPVLIYMTYFAKQANVKGDRSLVLFFYSKL
jgi:hypothetical protein